MNRSRGAKGTHFFLLAGCLFLLQACAGHSFYSYRVRATENFHEECGYAFDCLLQREPYPKGDCLVVSVGVVDDPGKGVAENTAKPPCKSPSEIESVSVELPGGGSPLTPAGSMTPHRYTFTDSALKEKILKHRKLVLKIFFRGQKLPKIFC